ncbi:MAG TPA: CAP domain-containing protein [Polyangia bacterium]
MACVACAATPAPDPGKAVTPVAEVTPVAPPRPPRRPQRPPTIYTPSGGGAASYVSPPLSAAPAADRFGKLAPWERDLLRVVAEIAKAEGRTPPIPDARLHRVSLDVARASRGNQPPPSDALRFLINHQGVIETEPAIYTLTGPPNHPGIKESYRGPLGKLFARAAWNRVGLGSQMKGDDITVVLTLWEQLVELQPVPRRLPSEGRTPLSMRFLVPFTSPQIVVTLPGGQVRALPTTVDGNLLKSELRCQSGDGRYQVEILASGKSGPTVLGNFPVFCGVDPPDDLSAYDEDDTENLDPADAEQELAALINQARQAAGAKPLVWDNRLAAIARAHSRDMVANNFIAHVSPTTGDAVARVKRAGLALTPILENVGQEGGVEKAHRGFMASPAHRANILNPKVTRIGIGIVIKAGGGAPLHVTELFTGE